MSTEAPKRRGRPPGSKNKLKDGSPKPLKVPKSKVISKTRGFNLLENGSTFKDAVRESMIGIKTTIKAGPMGAMMNNRLLVPIPEFPFAYLLHARGIPAGTVIDIIAPDAAGKTTLLYTIMGWGMRHNCPGLVIETENKPMTADRIRQCLHRDKSIAELMYQALIMEQAFELSDAYRVMTGWLDRIRDPKESCYWPLHKPAIIGLDSFSKLMSRSEASALAQYGALPEEEETDKKSKKGKKKKEDKIKEIGEGSNMAHSKMAHGWCRELPARLRSQNAILILCRHQNDKVDMTGGGGGSFIPKWVQEGFNRTSIGGKAFNQNASFQLILSKIHPEYAVVKGEKVQVGQYIKAVVSKNSYAPPKKIEYRLSMDQRGETDNQQTPALDFNVALPDVLSATGLVQIKDTGKGCYSCKELGVEDVSADALADAFYRNPALIESLTQRLRLMGYSPDFNFTALAPGLEPVPEPADESSAPPDVNS